jgi:hypothetical protein
LEHFLHVSNEGAVETAEGNRNKALVEAGTWGSGREEMTHGIAWRNCYMDIHGGLREPILQKIGVLPFHVSIVH